MVSQKNKVILIKLAALFVSVVGALSLAYCLIMTLLAIADLINSSGQPGLILPLVLQLLLVAFSAFLTWIGMRFWKNPLQG